MRLSTLSGLVCLSLALAVSATAQDIRSQLEYSEKSVHKITASSADFLGGGLISDPSFEDGPPPAQTAWTTTNPTYLGGSPIFGPPVGGPDLARTGTWYAVLGSSEAALDTDIMQDVTVPAGDYFLEFYLLAGDNAGSQSEFFVSFDGTELLRFDIDDVGPYDGAYGLVSVPVSVASDGTFTLSFNQTKPAGPLINWFIDDVSLRAAVTGPALLVEPTALDFDPVSVGSADTLSVSVRNIGTESVTITSIDASGDDAFSVIGDDTDLDLDAGESTSFDVRFAPMSEGTFSTSIDIASNDPNSPTTVTVTGAAASPPENDDAEDAVALSGPGTYTGTNAFATLEAGEAVPSCQPSQGSSVWWAYTPSDDGSVSIDLSASDFDTVLTLLNPDGTELGCDDDGGDGLASRLVNIPVMGGTTYLIRVAGFLNSAGEVSEGSISFDLTEGGVLMTSSFSGTNDASSLFNRPTADGDGTSGSCSPRTDQTPFASVDFTVDGDGLYQITATWGGYDGYLLLYEGDFDSADPCVNLIERNDDFGGTAQSQIGAASLTTGTTYTLVVTTFSAVTAGDYDIEVVGPGTATFESGTAVEEGEDATSFLRAPEPNPTASTARVALTLDAPERITVTVLDLLGREVLVLHEGELAAGAAHTFEVDASALPAGQYIIRAQGESFASTERLTVIR